MFATEWLALMAKVHPTEKLSESMLKIWCLNHQDSQRRVLRQALERSGLDTSENVTFEQIEAARELLGPGRSGKRIEIPGDTVGGAGV